MSLLKGICCGYKWNIKRGSDNYHGTIFPNRELSNEERKIIEPEIVSFDFNRISIVEPSIETVLHKIIAIYCILEKIKEDQKSIDSFIMLFKSHTKIIPKSLPTPIAPLLF